MHILIGIVIWLCCAYLTYLLIAFLDGYCGVSQSSQSARGNMLLCFYGPIGFLLLILITIAVIVPELHIQNKKLKSFSFDLFRDYFYKFGKKLAWKMRK